MYSESGELISKIEKHPEWVRTEVDKILNEVMTGDAEMTKTQISNEVKKLLIKRATEGLTVVERINELINKGHIKMQDKNQIIRVLSLSNKEAKE